MIIKVIITVIIVIIKLLTPFDLDVLVYQYNIKVLSKINL